MGRLPLTSQTSQNIPGGTMLCKTLPVVWWIESGDTEFEDFHQQTLDWVRGLGLDPNRLAPQAAVVVYGGAENYRYELHVDEIGRDEATGHDRFDPLDEDNLLSFRRIIEVPKDSWPTRPAAVEVAA